MSEWFDGYWTAIKQVTAMIQMREGQGDPLWADIATSVGTVLAAGVAAFAAWQSMLAARQSAKVPALGRASRINPRCQYHRGSPFSLAQKRGRLGS